MNNSNTVPLLMQWDERWGYSDYAGNLFGLTSTELPLNEPRIASELKQNHPIVCIMGPGNQKNND